MKKWIAPLAFVGVIVVVGIIFIAGRDDEKTNQSTNTPSTAQDQTINQTEDDMKNIVEIAAGDDRFTTLVTAVQTAGLVETLSSEGPFTVFAPTNDAFAALGKETLDAVLADKEKLTSVLTYHVVPGKLMAADVLAQKSLTTVQGSNLAVTASPEAKVDNAKIVITDLEASNGVIHVIDKVLLP